MKEGCINEFETSYDPNRVVIFVFYWWQIRPTHIKSVCSEISFLRAKSYQYDTDIWDLYLSLTSSPTYKGFNFFLKRKYKNNKNFLLEEFDTKDYNSEYSRCVHEYGL
jgi:hypothetical protein